MTINQEKLILMALNPDEDEWVRDDAIGDLVYFPDKNSIDTLIKLINDVSITDELRTVSCETIADILVNKEVISLNQLMEAIPSKEFKRIEAIMIKYKDHKKS